MISKQFIWRTLQREVKTLELKIVMLVLGLSTVFLLMITLGLKNVASHLSDNAQSLLGGALIVESSSPIPSEVIEQAQNYDLTYTQNIGFFTMASGKDQFLLIQVEAFDSSFPLIGKLEINKNDGVFSTNELPTEGNVWATDNLFNHLNISVNDTIQIADYPLTVAAKLITFPFMLSNTSSFSPIIYMHMKDVYKLDVIHPGSRVNYRLILKGDNQNIHEFLSTPDLRSGTFKITTEETGRQSIAKPFEIIERYLSIIIIIQSLLASIVIGVSVSEYAKRQLPVVAILRTLGASHQVIISTYGIALSLLFAVIITVGVLFGYSLLSLIFSLLQPFGISSIQWYGSSLCFTLSMVLVMAVFCSAPAILSLKHIPIQIMLRSKASMDQVFKSHYHFMYFLALILMVGMVCLYTEEFIVPLRLLALFTIVAVLGFCVSFLVWGIFKVCQGMGSHSVRFALNTLLKHRWQGIMQCTVYILIFSLLIFSAIIQWDILSVWRAQLPKETPNYFLVNIQAHEIDELTYWFQANQLSGIDFYPVVRARYSHMNNKPVSTWGTGQRDPTAHLGLRRPINLTWMKNLPEDNKPVGGADWKKVQSGALSVSVEVKFAQRHEISLGDILTFQIQDKAISAKVVQLRTLSWQSFRPNFYIIFPVDVLDKFPHTLMGSFYLPLEMRHKIGALHRQFPQISIIDLEAVLQQVSTWVFKVSSILEIILSLILLSGMLLMAIMMRATLKARVHESALLKCLGASREFLKKIIIIEYMILGGICGVVSGFLAQMVMHDIAYDYFDINYNIGWKWILIGFGGSVTLLVSLGLLGFRRVINTAPIQILRNAK